MNGTIDRRVPFALKCHACPRHASSRERHRLSSQRPPHLVGSNLLTERRLDALRVQARAFLENDERLWHLTRPLVRHADDGGVEDLWVLE